MSSQPTTVLSQIDAIYASGKRFFFLILFVNLTLPPVWNSSLPVKMLENSSFPTINSNYFSLFIAHTACTFCAVSFVFIVLWTYQCHSASPKEWISSWNTEWQAMKNIAKTYGTELLCRQLINSALLYSSSITCKLYGNIKENECYCLDQDYCFTRIHRLLCIYIWLHKLISHTALHVSWLQTYSKCAITKTQKSFCEDIISSILSLSLD